MKVLYLFSGTRNDKFKGVMSRDFPDTQFYGLNHFAEFGVEAENKEFSDLVKNKFLGKFLGFRFRHLFMFFLARNYDIVFGSSLLYMMGLKKIFRAKSKFVFFNLGLTRTLMVNKDRLIKFKILRWLISEVDGIVCLSNSQKEFLENTFPFLRGRVFFAPLGVDTTYYQPKYEGRKDFLLAAGRDNGRDYKTVVEAARLLPNQAFEIVCSPRNLEGVIDIPKNVTVHFDLPIAELNKKYQEAALLLLITHADNFLDGSDCSGQTVLLDAMASGLPVIVSRKKYLSDYVEQGKEVCLVDFYAPQDVAEKVQSLSDPQKRKQMAGAARRKVEQAFSTTEMAKNLTKIFSEIMK